MLLAKQFAHAISTHYCLMVHAYVYWIWLRGSASYVIITHVIEKNIEKINSDDNKSE